MRDHDVVLAVAAYTSKAAAEQVFDAVGRVRDGGERSRVAAVVLGKGPDGALAIDRIDCVAPDEAWSDALLGAALTVLAAPVGIRYLPPVVTAQAGWSRVAALVAHLWENIPQVELHRMTDMLESSAAGVVVVAYDHPGEKVEALLSDAVAAIVTHKTTVSLDADLMSPLDDADI